MIAARALSPLQWHDVSQPITAQVIPLFGNRERSWLLSAADSVAKLAALPDNWDGSGSPRVKPATVTRAVEVLYTLGVAVEPMSHACPIPGGGLQLEWDVPGRYLEIEVFPDGSVEYLRQKAGEDATEGQFLLTDLSTVQEIVGFLSHR